MPGLLPVKFSMRYSRLPRRPALGLIPPGTCSVKTRLTLCITVHACDSNWPIWLLEILPTGVSNEQPPDKHSRSLVVSEASQTYTCEPNIYMFIYGSSCELFVDGPRSAPAALAVKIFGIDRESIEVRESTRVVLGDFQTYICF